MPKSVVIPANTTSVDLIVTALDDSIAEPSETVTLRLRANRAYHRDANRTGRKATVTIVDNEPEVSITAIDAAAAETATRLPANTGTFRIGRDAAGDAPLTVFFTRNGTAKNGKDYVAVPKSVVIPAGDTFVDVTVSPIDDSKLEPSETVGLTLQAKPAYHLVPNVANRSATVTVADNDSFGILATPTTGLVTTEAGVAAQFTVVLTRPPTANVTIGLTSSDTTEGTVSPPGLTFTPSDWNVPQTVTVTGVDDAVVDGGVTYTVASDPAVSDDPAYVGQTFQPIALTNLDNDGPGIQVTPTTGLVTTEAGGTAQFTVVLNSQPIATVTIGLSSNDTTEGTVSTPSLTFTPADWNVPQTVTVTGVDDAAVDGDIAYTVITAPAVSADPIYNGLNPADIAASNVDDDAAGIAVSPTSALQTTEAGGTAQFTVVLTSQPIANVTIDLSSSDTTEGTVSPPSLIFNSANWNVPQTVTVTGVDDALVDGNVNYTVVADPTASADPTYRTLSAVSVAVVNIDNDGPGIQVTPTTGLVTTEAGGTAQFTVVLNSQPIANVTVGLSSNNTAEGTVSTPSLIFTPSDWNVPQTVTITGVNDAVDDGDIAYTVITAPAVSDDLNYNTLNAVDVAVVNIDNDARGFNVTMPTPQWTTEFGDTARFTVALNSQPTVNVTIDLSSSDTTEGTVSPSRLTFTPVNWSVPQEATITGLDDNIDDGDVAYQIYGTVGGDPLYSALAFPPVQLSNLDNDTAGLEVDPIIGLVTYEDPLKPPASFGIRLTSEPTAAVQVNLRSNMPDEGQPGVTAVVFTAANWNEWQTVQVFGVDDDVVDGDQLYWIFTDPVSSFDPKYHLINPPLADVSVTNIDNDSRGVIVTPISGLITTEDGGSTTFSVVLKSQPTSPVNISLHTNDTTEGIANALSLVFTKDDWNLPQTVQIVGQDDDLVDGDQPYTIIIDPAVSTDPLYNGLDPEDVSVVNLDNDVAPEVASVRIDFATLVLVAEDPPFSKTWQVVASGTAGGPVGSVLYLSGYIVGDTWTSGSWTDLFPNSTPPEIGREEGQPATTSWTFHSGPLPGPYNNAPYIVSDFVAFVEGGGGGQAWARRAVTSSSPLLAPAEKLDGRENTAPLTTASVARSVDEATALWMHAGLDKSAIDGLGQVHMQIADLPGSLLGLATPAAIYLDRNAAGYGWFIDPTPTSDEEFTSDATGRGLTAAADSPAFGRIDLLTVLEHELGHVLGLGHSTAVDDLMADVLTPGLRRSPSPDDIDLVFSSGDWI